MSNINLLPWREEKIFYENNIFYALCTLVSVTCITLTILVNCYIKILIKQQQQNIAYLNSEIATYKGKIQEINGLKERKKLLLNKLEVINSLQSRRAYVVGILDRLVRAVPDGINLNYMELKEPVLTIQGRSESNTRVSLFMRNLEGLNMFSNPTLQEITVPQNQANPPNEHGISFVLQVKVLG